jgi:hypothetical protein
VALDAASDGSDAPNQKDALKKVISLRDGSPGGCIQPRSDRRTGSNGIAHRVALEDLKGRHSMNKIYSALLAASMLFASALPASAQSYHHRRHYRSSHYYNHGDRRSYHGHGVGPGRGALIGGAGGAVIGGALGGGKGALIGGALGAGGGALAGQANQNHKRNEYNRPR